MNDIVRDLLFHYKNKNRFGWLSTPLGGAVQLSCEKSFMNCFKYLNNLLRFEPLPLCHHFTK